VVHDLGIQAAPVPVPGVQRRPELDVDAAELRGLSPRLPRLLPGVVGVGAGGGVQGPRLATEQDFRLRVSLDDVGVRRLLLRRELRPLPTNQEKRPDPAGWYQGGGDLSATGGRGGDPA
jgi:hypothetical protein